MNIVISGFFTNISATWFIAIFLIPQSTLINFYARKGSIILNIVGAMFFLFLAVIFQ